MTKTIYAVTTMGVITNISYDHEGQVKWCKAIFNSELEATERRDYMNELNHGVYEVKKVTVSLHKSSV